jgi:epoxyqueuosine reductase
MNAEEGKGAMRRVNEPTYQRFIKGPMERFDDRNSGFSRGFSDPEGPKYSQMHQRSIENIRKKIRGKGILDHALWVGARRVDYTMRRYHLARDEDPLYNKEIKMDGIMPRDMSGVIKRVARWLGADLVGIAKLNPLWLYSNWGPHACYWTGAAEPGDPIDIPDDYRYVIVLIHEMRYEWIKRSPAVEPETDLCYSKMGWCATSLAAFIRELGYRAIPAGNELGLSIPMAVDAGLGELSRMGLLITREYGPRVRISKVVTNLPLEVDQPIDIGVQGFCEKCERCAHHCPSGAIKLGARTEEPWDESNSRGMLKWPVKAMKCFDWWVKNGTHCSVCIRVCPWNKPNTLFHRGVRFLAERNILTKALVCMDEWVGYGKQNIWEI